MEIEKDYSNPVERRQIINEMESQGYRHIHDNYDPDWHPGEAIRGTLTFTDYHAPSKPPPRDLAAEIDAIKLRLDQGGL